MTDAAPMQPQDADPDGPIYNEETISIWVALWLDRAMESLLSADEEGKLSAVDFPTPDPSDTPAACIGAILAVGIVAQAGGLTPDDMSLLITSVVASTTEGDQNG